ncbi:hypothetical protein IAT38_000958 [Cryptococcus sp. DSM 104549]
MSVPLPSPSPLSPAPPPSGGGATAKPIPSSRSRPTPISIGAHSPSSPGAIGTGAGTGGGAGAGAGSLKYRAPSSIGRSFHDDNWRDRSPAPGSHVGNGNGSVSAGPGGIAQSLGNGNGGRGPERTVGFEKRGDAASARGGSLGGGGGGGGGVGSGLTREKEKDKKDEKDADGKAALSHVPCRFFKAGACTAGDSCPFSHAAPDSAKREICQWFLKGNCKFGHKCALAHVRPGEPMSMDRKNKKAAQLEARAESAPNGSASLGSSLGNSASKRPPSALPVGSFGHGSHGHGHAHSHGQGHGHGDETGASPVPIRSALSSSLASPPTGRITASSPLREPFGPPSGGLANSPSTGFAAHPRSAHPAFASSPSRPSPLSASFGSGSVPAPLSLKNSMGNPLGSPLRPPVTAAPAFSSSFSQATVPLDRAPAQPVPLSASFAGPGDNASSSLHKSIWARSDVPAEPLSPRRPIPRSGSRREDVFVDEDDHGEEFLPSSLSDLLTPLERARRMSRRDSQDSSYSPSRAAFAAQAPPPLWGGERLAQSAGATMGPKGFLQGLWSADGEDARKAPGPHGHDFSFGPATAQPAGPRTSLLTQQRSPTSPSTSPIGQGSGSIGDRFAGLGNGAAPGPHPPAGAEPYLRNLGDPDSPSSRALKEHAPGQSLPGGLASALSRLHLRGPRSPSGLSAGGVGAAWGQAGAEGEGEGEAEGGRTPRREEHDEGLFAMDG